MKEKIEPRFLSLHEAAEVLGIAYITAFNYTKKGILKSVKLGNRRLIPVAAIDELVNEALSPSK